MNPASAPPVDDARPMPARSRFPAWVYRHGQEPDPRFTLANERTLLAWIRTALAMIAGGVALEALTLPIRAGLRLGVELTLLTLGLAIPLIAWWSWGTTERAMRRAEPLPSPKLGLPVVLAVILVALVLGIDLLIRGVS